VPSIGRVSFSASPTGVLIYRTTVSTRSQITMYDRSGKQIQPIGDAGDYRGIRLSPDEARLAVHRHDDAAGGGNLWLTDLQRGITSRFTLGKSHEAGPVWSNDGNRVAYESLRDGSSNIYQKLSSGAGEEESLVTSPNHETPSDWSHDGRYLLYVARGSSMVLFSAQDRIWVFPLFGDRKPFPFTKSDFSEQGSRCSPNGRWVVYSSDESGKREIYVRPFPSAESKWQVSNNGGTDPQWRSDGRELFYISADRKLMAVQVKTDAAAFESGVPEALFATRNGSPPSYAATTNGQRFIINERIDDSVPSITVVLNWTAGLKQ